MAYLNWTKELDTGIEVIDGQHRQIVDYINQLDDARHTRNRTVIGKVIDDTIDYTISHFGFEETLIEDADYEFTRPHKKVHELFVKRVGEYKTRFENGEEVADDLHGLLYRWLFNHILNDDAAYVSAVKASISEKAGGNGSNLLKRSLKRFFG